MRKSTTMISSKIGKIIAIGMMAIIITGIVSYFYFFQSDDSDPDDEIVKPCEEFHLFSPVGGGLLTIKIALPDNYAAAENLQSIYLSDANYFFTKSGSLDNLLDNEEGMTDITSRLIENQQIPSAVLIGIGYTEDQRMALTLNGAESYYTFIKDKLIPEIESRCKVSTSPDDRIFFGYSASGHFSTFTLMNDVYNEVHTFNKYISLAGVYDPSFGFTDIKALNMLQDITNEKGLSAFSGRYFYCGVGTEDDLLFGNRNITDILIDRDYQNFNFNYKEYTGFGHYDIPEIGYEDGMKWLFDV